jgi:hypothetical protein
MRLRGAAVSTAPRMNLERFGLVASDIRQRKIPPVAKDDSSVRTHGETKRRARVARAEPERLSYLVAVFLTCGMRLTEPSGMTMYLSPVASSM